MANKKQPRKLITAAIQVLESLDSAHELGGNKPEAKAATLSKVLLILQGEREPSKLALSPADLGFDEAQNRVKQRTKRINTSLERFAHVVSVAPEGMAEEVVEDITKMFG